MSKECYASIETLEAARELMQVWLNKDGLMKYFSTGGQTDLYTLHGKENAWSCLTYDPVKQTHDRKTLFWRGEAESESKSVGLEMRRRNPLFDRIWVIEFMT